MFIKYKNRLINLDMYAQVIKPDGDRIDTTVIKLIDAERNSTNLWFDSQKERDDYFDLISTLLLNYVSCDDSSYLGDVPEGDLPDDELPF